MDLPEDWQLSQFWYTDATADALASAVAAAVANVDQPRIACISAPTLYRLGIIGCLMSNDPLARALKRLNKPDLRAEVFEYDNRFAAFGSDFHFFDYKAPLEVNLVAEKLCEPGILLDYVLALQRWTATSENSLTSSLPTPPFSVTSASPRLQSQSGALTSAVVHG